MIKLNKNVPILGDVFVLAAQCGHRIDADKDAALLLVRIKVAAKIAQLRDPPLTGQRRALAFWTTVSVALKRLRTGRSVEVNSSSGSLILQQQIAAD